MCYTGVFASFFWSAVHGQLSSPPFYYHWWISQLIICGIIAQRGNGHVDLRNQYRTVATLCAVFQTIFFLLSVHSSLKKKKKSQLSLTKPVGMSQVLCAVCVCVRYINAGFTASGWAWHCRPMLHLWGPRLGHGDSGHFPLSGDLVN